MSGMNNLLQLVMQAQGGNSAQNIASMLGMNKKEADTGLSALLPAISSAMKQNSQNPQGFAQLMNALQSGRHEQYADDPDTLAKAETVNDGNAILGHLFGSKEVSRQVADAASKQTGLDPSKLKKLLPLAAVLAMGAMSKKTRGSSMKGQLASLAMGAMLAKGASGAGGGLLSGLLGGGKRKQHRAEQDHQKGLGLLGGLLDSDDDGNVMDDILKKALKGRF